LAKRPHGFARAFGQVSMFPFVLKLLYTGLVMVDPIGHDADNFCLIFGHYDITGFVFHPFWLADCFEEQTGFAKDVLVDDETLLVFVFANDEGDHFFQGAGYILVSIQSN
jgi:hypothetical protein